MNEEKSLKDYNPKDIGLALCRMISYNIAQIAYLNAKRYNLKRIFFGGFFIRGHPFTMQTLSYAINFWSKGEMRALFLRHEGFLGALGAFLMYEEGASSTIIRNLSERRDSRANFVERFTVGRHYSPSGEVKPRGKLERTHSEKSWVEKFMEVGRQSAGMAKGARGDVAASRDPSSATDYLTGVSEYDLWGAETNYLSSGLDVGVLHVDPSLYQFPLLVDPASYEPSVVDISKDEEQRSYWIGVLDKQIPATCEKALASQGESEEAQQKCDAFKWMFGSHLEKLLREPQVYGKFGLCEILEMREECLRECGFKDTYIVNKESENAAALKVLPDLLAELDAMDESARLLSLIEGVLAGNIFDWGSQACVELYKNGTILEIYKQARSNLKSRPWRVDTFDDFRSQMLRQTETNQRYRRAIMFVDNSGADIVLGMIPLVRELLKRGTEVVLAANSLPALNDITASELLPLMKQAGKFCEVIRGGLETARDLYKESRGVLPDVQPLSPTSPAYSPLYIIQNGQGGPCLNLRRVSHDLAVAAKGADLVVLEGMGRSIHSNYNTKFMCDTLKLAMVKNRVLAETIFNGEIYDCVCLFEKAEAKHFPHHLGNILYVQNKTFFPKERGVGVLLLCNYALTGCLSSAFLLCPQPLDDSRGFLGLPAHALRNDLWNGVLWVLEGVPHQCLKGHHRHVLGKGQRASRVVEVNPVPLPLVLPPVPLAMLLLLLLLLPLAWTLRPVLQSTRRRNLPSLLDQMRSSLGLGLNLLSQRSPLLSQEVADLLLELEPPRPHALGLPHAPLRLQRPHLLENRVPPRPPLLSRPRPRVLRRQTLPVLRLRVGEGVVQVAPERVDERVRALPVLGNVLVHVRQDADGIRALLEDRPPAEALERPPARHDPLPPHHP
eukprot:CAMPEP_0197489484 /NCGR_PEP_ID=MMETSP1311-20131121/4267_1 /TAXON_ID=464262 /ORGANISM="Genus nov. species nov., Strain RCC856" /LENGTH=895 /DNA_ID=CAMNT_0043033803 /DNA_START=51 /DNA_END=2736 /DNA_ORIENTATION=+